MQKPIRNNMLNFLNETIPWSIPVFSYIKEQLLAGTIIGLVIYLIFANIPLIPSLPGEAYFLFAYIKGTNAIALILVTTLIFVIYAAISYLIGLLFGRKLVEKIVKKPITYNKFLDKFSSPLIFFAYLITPLSLHTILTLIFGVYRTGFKKLIIIVTIATFLKYLAIILLYEFYSPVIERYIPINSWLKVS